MFEDYIYHQITYMYNFQKVSTCQKYMSEKIQNWYDTQFN